MDPIGGWVFCALSSRFLGDESPFEPYLLICCGILLGMGIIYASGARVITVLLSVIHYEHVESLLNTDPVDSPSATADTQTGEVHDRD